MALANRDILLELQRFGQLIEADPEREEDTSSTASEDASEVGSLLFLSIEDSIMGLASWIFNCGSVPYLMMKH